MACKKEPCKFTVQFNPSDPCHQQTVSILNQQGRRKAQFIVNAIMHYLHCTETPEIPQTMPIDTTVIESIVRDILEKQSARIDKSTSPAPIIQHSVRQSETIQFNDAEEILGEAGMAAIAKSMANFRRK